MRTAWCGLTYRYIGVGDCFVAPRNAHVSERVHSPIPQFDSQLRVDSPQAFAAIQFMMCVCNVWVIVADEEGTSAIDRKLLNAIATAKRRAAHIATGFAVQTPLHMGMFQSVARICGMIEQRFSRTVFAIHSHILNRETWSAMHDLLRDTENMAPPVRGCHATRDASVEKYGQPLTTAHLNVMPTMFPMWRASSEAMHQSIYDVILLPRTTTSSLSNIFDTPAVPLDHVVSCMRRALISYSRATDMQRPFASEREWYIRGRWVLTRILHHALLTHRMRFASRVAFTISSTMADKTVPAVAREKAESRTRCIDNE